MTTKEIVAWCMRVPRHRWIQTTSLMANRLSDAFALREWEHLHKFIDDNPHYEHYRDELLKNTIRFGDFGEHHEYISVLLDGHMRTRAMYELAFQQKFTGFQLAALIREMFMFTFPIHRDIIIIRELGKRELNQKRARILRRKCQSELATNIVNQYYNQTMKLPSSELFYMIKGHLTYHKDAELWDDRLTKLYYDATLDWNFKPEHKTTTVVQLARGIKWSEDWSTLPILADALQDAGYDSTARLEALRDPYTEIRQASSLFRSLAV